VPIGTVREIVKKKLIYGDEFNHLVNLRNRRIIEYYISNRFATKSGIAEHMGLNPKVVYDQLKRITDDPATALDREQMKLVTKLYKMNPRLDIAQVSMANNLNPVRVYQFVELLKKKDVSRLDDAEKKRNYGSRSFLSSENAAKQPRIEQPNPVPSYQTIPVQIQLEAMNSGNQTAVLNDQPQILQRSSLVPNDAMTSNQDTTTFDNPSINEPNQHLRSNTAAAESFRDTNDILKEMIENAPLSDEMKIIMYHDAVEKKMKPKSLQRRISTIIGVLLDSWRLPVPELAKKYGMSEEVINGYLEFSLDDQIEASRVIRRPPQVFANYLNQQGAVEIQHQQQQQQVPVQQPGLEQRQQLPQNQVHSSSNNDLDVLNWNEGSEITDLYNEWSRE
jgi:hypothetical protein